MSEAALNRCASLAAIASLVLVTGCSGEAEGPPVGANCTIQLRRDLMSGTGDKTRIGGVTGAITHYDTINNARTSVSGKLTKANKAWLVVQSDDGVIWIPRSVVMYVKVAGKPS